MTLDKPTTKTAAGPPKKFYVSHNERSESGAFFSAALDFCFFSSRKRKKARGRRYEHAKQKTYGKINLVNLSIAVG